MSDFNIPAAWRCVVMREAEGTTRIALAGDLDMAVAREFGAALEHALSESSTVVVDLSELAFMDSSGMHLLASADVCARRSDTRLVIAHPSSSVLRVLELTGMDAVLEIVDASGPSVL